MHSHQRKRKTLLFLTHKMTQPRMQYSHEKAKVFLGNIKGGITVEGKEICKLLYMSVKTSPIIVSAAFRIIA